MMQATRAEQLVQDVEMEDDSSEYFYEGNTHCGRYVLSTTPPVVRY